MSELTDEELALKLQAQFDEEADSIHKQEEIDHKLAMDLVGKHDMSDSGSDVQESRDDYEDDTESDLVPDEDSVCHLDTIAASKPTSDNVKKHADDVSDETPDEDELIRNDRLATLPNTSGVDQKEASMPSVSAKKEHCISDSDSNDSYSQKSDTIKPFCKYGSKCFRKNPEHRRQFQHADTPGWSNDYGSQPKKSKLDDETPSFSERYGFYLTSVAGISSQCNKTAVLSIQDILSPKWGKLIASAQFSYIIDVNWLVSQYPCEFNTKPLLIVYGDNRDTTIQLRTDSARHAHIKLCPARLEIMFGTHHTKMMLLQYEDGMRVVVHTANLVQDDWHQKTQGIWMSPKFPCVDNGTQDSPTNFRSDLLDYLKAYNSLEIKKWCDIIVKHNFSSASVFLIASTPGRHKEKDKHSFGHLKLRRVLKDNGPRISSDNSKWPVIAQFSSIGSLGKTSDNWLCKEFLTSLSTTKNLIFEKNLPKLQLIYPSAENVRLSLEGYPAGGSLPYSKQVADKQKWLNAYLHCWKSDARGRTRASPHIKTYCRISPNHKDLAWFLVTSANLSKAAWGALEKNDAQLMIRSYELGVLFLPQYFSSSQDSSSSFSLMPANQLVPKNSDAFPLPYDVPLTPYSSSDEPWLWDVNHVKLPDRHGNMWMPKS